MANNDIKQLVKTSFLRNEQKAFLLELLDSGELKKFEKEFERMLIEEIERRKNAHFAICEKFSQEMKARKDAVENKQAALLKIASDKLAKISITDIAGRRQVWLDYDAKIQQMNETLLNDLDVLFSKLTVQHI